MEMTGEMKHAQRAKELMAKRMGVLLKTAYESYDKIYNNQIDDKDVEKFGADMQEKATQAEEIKKTLRKIPFFGQLADIAKDIAELYKRAFALMLENMKMKKKHVENEANENANRFSAVKQYNDFDATFENNSKQKPERSVQKRYKNIARTNINYDQDPNSKNKESVEVVNETKIKSQAKDAQAKLDAYNRRVAERAKVNAQKESQSQSFGAMEPTVMKR